MTPEQKAAYVHAMAVAATAEIEAMKAENWMREMHGATVAYNEDTFRAVIEKYGIHHNAIVSLFQEGGGR